MMHRNIALSYESTLGYLFLATMAVAAFFPLALAAATPLSAICGCALFYYHNKRCPKIDTSIILCAITLAGLQIMSSFWSIKPAESLEHAFKVIPIFLLSCPLFFLLKELPEKSRKIFEKWAILPLLVMGCILYIELKFNYPLYRWVRHLPFDIFISQANLSKHVAAFMLLTPFGIIFALRARFVTLSALLLILGTLVLTVTESQSAQLCFAVMLIAPLALLVMPKATPFLTFAGLGFLIVFLPWISPVLFAACADLFTNKASFMGQANLSMHLESWNLLSRRIMENPWTGFGIDSTRYMTFDTEQKYFLGNTILHPHNIALQIWIEFGLIGISLTCAMLVFLYRRLVKLPLTQQIMPYTIFCAMMVFLLASWSAWTGWVDGLILWVAALLLLVIKPKESRVTS